MGTEQEMKQEVRNAIAVLKNDGVILCPTDTVWGLACDATNPMAVERLLSLKKRDRSKGMLVLVSHDAMVERYVNQVPDVAWELIENADSPLTVIYPKGKNFADGVTAADGSIGIRVITEGFCHEVIRLFNRPLVSTSANFSGFDTPGYFYEIDGELIDATDGVFGQDFEEITGKPSSIIQLGLGGEVKIVRK